MPGQVLSTNFADALAWVVHTHATQVRHNTRTPYVSHLLATCAIVIEEGGNETTAIGALLHDVLEDHPITRAELRDRFGDDVYRIVDDCTDADLTERRDRGWRERRQSHLGRMSAFPDDSLLVIAADKVCSLQSLLDDLKRYGQVIFEHGSRPASDLLWSYREVLRTLELRLNDRPVVRRLGRLVDEFAAAL